MSNIIQSVSITKHINPSKQVSDEYTMMIGFHDYVYITKIKEESFKSNLFEFDMLEQLIYNCNHKQKVGDVSCDMEIKESEAFGKVLDIKLMFERDVRPMKKIIEEHEFQLQEKKLDYDDKIGLAMNNLRSEINFVEIKPTTKMIIITLSIWNNTDYLYFGCTRMPHGSFYHYWNDTNLQQKRQNILNNIEWVIKNKKYDINKIIEDLKFVSKHDSTLDINKVVGVGTYVDFLIDFLTKYFTKESSVTYKFSGDIDKLIKSFLINYFVDAIKFDKEYLLIFIDETKKPNNRKIRFYKSIEEFEQSREQFKSYHILEFNSYGILIEEIA